MGNFFLVIKCQRPSGQLPHWNCCQPPGRRTAHSPTGPLYCAKRARTPTGRSKMRTGECWGSCNREPPIGRALAATEQDCPITAQSSVSLLLLQVLTTANYIGTQTHALLAEHYTGWHLRSSKKRTEQRGDEEENLSRHHHLLPHTIHHAERRARIITCHRSHQYHGSTKMKRGFALAHLHAVHTGSLFRCVMLSPRLAS